MPMAAAVVVSTPVSAGPVVCSTSLEAPGGGAAPVEVTRCGPITTTAELLEQRFYSYTAPYASGVDITHQISDILGLAIPGRNSGRVVAFGFPDQTIIWDGSALEATTRVLQEAQSAPLPWRSADRSNGFCQGLPTGGCGLSGGQPPAWPPAHSTLIRGLW